MLSTITSQLSAAALSFLDARAKRIKELTSNWSKNTIALGQEFKKAREKFPTVGAAAPTASRPGWREWIKQETMWEHRHVRQLIQIADKFGDREDLPNLSYKVMDILSREDVPEEAIDEAIRQVRGGKKIGREQARDIVIQHLPTRSAAIREAQETGRLVAARDGHMYSGIDDKQAAAYSERRHMTYSIRDAINEIAECDLTPQQWLKQAEDRWINDLAPGTVDRAAKWLDKLREPLLARQKVIDHDA